MKSFSLVSDMRVAMHYEIFNLNFILKNHKIFEKFRSRFLNFSEIDNFFFLST